MFNFSINAVNDISKHFTGSTYFSRSVAQLIVDHEGTPEALQAFAAHADKLDDYSYWFFLSTCWVSYTGWSDLDLWKELFSSDRPKRKHCIMKPSEVRAFEFLPQVITVYRAHRPNEEDWIAYTLSPDIAKRFANERGVTNIHKYHVNKRHVLALFLRRGEEEILVLDKEHVKLIEEIQIQD